MSHRLPSIERTISSIIRSSFICPACRHQRAVSSGNPTRTLTYLSAPRRALQSRAASTTASVTAVNAQRQIPRAFEKLYEALKALEHEAAVYVDTSQLQLALRGVESENAVIRVAVLGLNGDNGARRLTRALLADPLASESDWERQLTDHDENDGRAILLRYAEKADIDRRHPLVKTLFVPSSILHSHNLEILVQAINPNTIPTNTGAASFLIPELGDTVNGRFSSATYPVHRALVYGESMKALASIAFIANRTGDDEEDNMVRGVVDGSWNALQPGTGQEGPISPVNLNLGEVAIDVFRKSIERSVEYEHTWFDSGMPGVSSWLTESTAVQPSVVKPPVRSLIQTICDSANQAVLDEEASELQQKKAATIPEATRSILGQGITIWAENAHTELRDGLHGAFTSKSWKKIKWWKLFWRVDDVGYITSDVLQRAWLVEAEKEMIWVSGRIHQSGLLGPTKLRPTRAPNPDSQKKLGHHPPAPRLSEIVPRTSLFEVDEGVPAQHPWPQDISLARSSLLSITVPPFQTLAQSQLLQTISTSVLASSISALLYVSVSTTSPYEVGTIAAVGIVYSLRRLQSRWDAAKREWGSRIREDGRRVLRNAEQTMREVVRDGGKPEVDEIGVRERRKAREAVGRVVETLEEMGS